MNNFDAGALPLALTLVLLGIWFVAGCERLFASVAAGFGWHFGNFAQPIHDATRLLLDEFRPDRRPDPLLWLGGPLILLGAVMAALSVLPLDGVRIGAGLGIGVVFFTGLYALIILAAYLSARGTGRGRMTRLPPIAGQRYLRLILVYELPLALAVAAAALPSGALRLDMIVAAQQSGWWNCLLMPVGFLVYLLCGVALSFWAPLRLIEDDDASGAAGSRLSRSPLLVWRLGHYALMLTVAAFAVPLFLGGGAGPWLPAPLWVLLKVLLLLVILSALPYALPRGRLDRIMRTAWAWLVPLAIVNLMLVTLVLRLWE